MTTRPFLFFLLCLLGGCATTDYDPNVMALERQLERRTLQSRWFENVDETELMRSIVSTLQDHHFRILRVDHAFGLVSAWQSTRKKGGSPLGGRSDITVVIERRNEREVRVRASMRTGVENPEDPLLYQQFFAALQRNIEIRRSQLP